jgi:hypothetical protein
MALVKCRECNKEISSTVKKCPHCGISKPYKPVTPSWSERSLAYKILAIFVGVIISFFLVMVITLNAKKEETLLNTLASVDEGNFSEKYSLYSRLHEIDMENKDYQSGLVSSGLMVLKTIPATKPDANLKVYKALNRVSPNKEYQDKIDFYNQMNAFAYLCTDQARKYTLSSVKIKSSFDSNLIYGDWKNIHTYLMVHSFSAKNSFGTTMENKAHYSCQVNYSPRELNLTRSSISGDS